MTDRNYLEYYYGSKCLDIFNIFLETFCEVPISGFIHSYVVAMRSGKQTHSEVQCGQWSAVYYTGGPKAESTWPIPNTWHTVTHKYLLN